MADDPYQLAIEQYAHWRSIGLAHWQMLEAIGVSLPWPVSPQTVLWCLARAEAERALAVRWAAS